MFRSILGIFLLVSTTSSWAAPAAELWPKWAQHSAESTQTIDHSAWDAFLKKYIQVDGDLNRLNYGGVTPEDRKSLDGYMQLLQSTKIRSYNKAEQKAYWINVYNAATVVVVLDHYPVDSIMKINISPGFFSRGPWGKKWLKIDGESLSLDDVEHRILRPLFKDARVHYAVNCASISCPNLRRDAFTADNTEQQLDAGAKAYIASDRGIAINKGKLTASSIYDWFSDDFGGSDAEVLRHMRSFATGGKLAQLKAAKKIHKYDYDWGLNDTQ